MASSSELSNKSKQEDLQGDVILRFKHYKLVEGSLVQTRKDLMQTRQKLQEIEGELLRVEQTLSTLELLSNALREDIPLMQPSEMRREVLVDFKVLQALVSRKEPMSTADLAQHVDETKSSLSQSAERNPMDMLKSEFRGLKLGDIVKKVLAERGEPITTADLARHIYETNSSVEFNRARNSLYAELRAELSRDKPRWKRVGKYAYEIV